MSEHGKMDITAQQESFKGFVKLFTVGTIGVIILLILMAIFLL